MIYKLDSYQIVFYAFLKNETNKSSNYYAECISAIYNTP